MRSSSRKMPDPGFQFGVKRTGLASLLCAIFRPGDAKAASVNAESVRLVVGLRSRDIALRDIETVEEKTGRLWAGIRLGYATGAATVSGLSRAEANALADAIETARVDWWRGTLAPQIGMFRSVHDRLAGFADPPRYVDVDNLRDLTRDALAAAGGLVARWPDSLSDVRNSGCWERSWRSWTRRRTPGRRPTRRSSPTSWPARATCSTGSRHGR